jgi:hypothetical protein
VIFTVASDTTAIGGGFAQPRASYVIAESPGLVSVEAPLLIAPSLPVKLAFNSSWALNFADAFSGLSRTPFPALVVVVLDEFDNVVTNTDSNMTVNIHFIDHLGQPKVEDSSSNFNALVWQGKATFTGITPNFDTVDKKEVRIAAVACHQTGITPNFDVFADNGFTPWQPAINDANTAELKVSQNTAVIYTVSPMQFFQTDSGEVQKIVVTGNGLKGSSTKLQLVLLGSSGVWKEFENPITYPGDQQMDFEVSDLPALNESSNERRFRVQIFSGTFNSVQQISSPSETMAVLRQPVVRRMSVDTGQTGTAITLTGDNMPLQVPVPSLVSCQIGEQGIVPRVIGILDGAGGVTCVAPTQMLAGSKEIFVSFNNDELDGGGGRASRARQECNTFDSSPSCFFTYWTLLGLSLSYAGAGGGGTPVSDIPFISNEGGQDRKRGILRLVVDGVTKLPVNRLQCEFSSSGNSTLVFTAIYVTNGFFFCPSPDVPWVGAVVVKLTTTGGLSHANNFVNIQMYERDSYSTMSTARNGGLEGPTFGNTTLIINGRNFPRPQDWLVRSGASEVHLVDAHCRFTEVDRLVKEVATMPMRVLGSSRMECETPSMKNGRVKVEYTFNGLDFKPAGLFRFQPCFPGQFSLDYTEPCKSCPLATSQPSKDQRECLPCRDTEYQNVTGQAQCLLCPLNNIVPLPVENRDALQKCECKPGFWNNDSLTGVSCDACPASASCAGGIAKPSALPGFYLERKNYNLIYQCVEASACPGGIEACATGYSGFLCGKCDDAFYQRDTQCVACQENSRAVFWGLISAVVILGIMAAMVAVIAGKSIPYQLYGAIGSTITFFQTVALLRNVRLDWPAPLLWTFNIFSFFLADLSVFQAECTVGYLSHFQKSCIILGMPALILFTISLLRLIHVRCTKFLFAKLPNGPDGKEVKNPRRLGMDEWRTTTMQVSVLICTIGTCAGGACALSGHCCLFRASHNSPLAPPFTLSVSCCSFYQASS